jgi:hypothetical protein
MIFDYLQATDHCSQAAYKDPRQIDSVVEDGVDHKEVNGNEMVWSDMVCLCF